MGKQSVTLKQGQCAFWLVSTGSNNVIWEDAGIGKEAVAIEECLLLYFENEGSQGKKPAYKPQVVWNKSCSFNL